MVIGRPADATGKADTILGPPRIDPPSPGPRALETGHVAPFGDRRPPEGGRGPPRAGPVRRRPPGHRPGAGPRPAVGLRAVVPGLRAVGPRPPRGGGGHVPAALQGR